MVTFETNVRFLGASSDGRTNKWEIICPVCGKKIIPPTTMLREQAISCEASKQCRNAGTQIVIDYNAKTLRWR